jgi:uncharacterized protein YjbI with pentapeptide repeats
MNERRASETAGEPPSPDGLVMPSSPSVTNKPNLPAIAADADDLKAIKGAVTDAAAVGGGLWLSYLFVLFYLAVAAGAVTQTDLFFQNPVKLPFLNIELPLLAFFFLSPILFLIVHAYTLVHLVMLTDKAKRFDQALREQIDDKNAAVSDSLRRQLPSNIFIQFLAGPKPATFRERAFRWLLWAIAILTLAVAPVFLLLLFQMQFLPFHSSLIVWGQRVVLLLDLGLMAWLWSMVLSTREVDRDGGWVPRVWAGLGCLFGLSAFLFSWTAATFPGEWQEGHLPEWRFFPARDLSGKSHNVSLHDWVFSSQIDPTTYRRWLPFSSTLVLTGLNVYEGLAIDDPKKAEWREFVFRARGRDLKGAALDLASLPKVDFEGAQLQGASLQYTHLEGASLIQAQLQGASLRFTHLEGAALDFAQLQGASLDFAKLQGASLVDVGFQAASLNLAQLEGANLRAAQLQGASLDGARLQGAALAGAQLQGASLQKAELQATDLSGALLWRSNSRGSGLVLTAIAPNAIKLRDWADSWLPSWREHAVDAVQPWNDKAYQTLRQMIETLPPAFCAIRRWNAFEV